MKIVSTSKEYEWIWSSVSGSELTLIDGIAGTLKQNNDYPISTFPNDSTVILGAPTTNLMHSLARTTATWEIPFNVKKHSIIEKSYLVIAAIRFFAGLHSKFYDSKVKIELNNNVIDYFGLRDKQEYHSDYFHLLPLPDIPLPIEISECKTIYTWPIITGKILKEIKQPLTITIDKYVRWDIDYLGVLVKMKKQHQIFISHNINDKNIARKLADDLNSKGIKVWIDEAEIKLGDSLIRKIREGIDIVDYLLVLLSKHSIDSEWVTKEVDIAMNQEIEGKTVKVLPVLLDDIDLPGFLKGKMYGDLRTMDQYDTLLSQIERRMME